MYLLWSCIEVEIDFAQKFQFEWETPFSIYLNSSFIR